MTKAKSRLHAPVDAALILDGHSRAALETLQSLGRSGIAVDLGATGDCLASRSRYCRRRLPQPDPSDREGFLAWLVGTFERTQYPLVVPATEASLRCLLLLPESHAIRTAAVLPATNSLEIALSKQRTWETAQSLGIPVPASRLITTMAEAIEPESYPVVLKPVASLVESGEGLVGLAPRIVRSPAAWIHAVQGLLRFGPVQVQQYVGGGGVGVECLYRGGQVLWHFQHTRLHELPLTGGGSSYRQSSSADPDLLAWTTRLLDSLQWHGAAMVEFKGSPEEGYRLMEINPRLWGSLALPIDAGVDFPLGLWCLACGKDPGLQPRYRSPYYTRNLEMDLDWLKENLKADHSDPLLQTRPKFRSFLEYGRPLWGRESWDHFDWRDWGVWGRVLANVALAVFRSMGAVLVRRFRLWRAWFRHRQVLAQVGSNNSKAIRILFVCYGNICRSPLAELYARSSFPHLEARSSGFHEVEGRTAPEWYLEVASGLGIDLSSWKSRHIDASQVEWAQLVALADLDNLDRFQREFPQAMGKATLMGYFLGKPKPVIDDPYNLDRHGARLAAMDVLASVKGMADCLGGKRS